jgi:3-methylcrotonyl-CoA carboxylase alpha subunit
VEWQLRVAVGESLPRRQEELAVHGHALEVRIYAEDPRNDFLPVTGRLAWLQPPQESEHVRVDTGVVQGDDVSIHYDPMIAKLVVWDETRPRALARLKRALAEYRIGGLTTNIAFLHNLVAHPAFAAEEVHTAFIEQHAEAIFRDAGGSRARQLPLAALYLLLARERQVAAHANRSADSFSPWHLGNAWRMGEPRRQRLDVLINGELHPVVLEEMGDASARRYVMHCDGRGLMLAGHLEGNELVASVEAHTERVTVVPHDRIYTLFDAQGAIEFALAEPDFGEDVEHAGAQAFAAPMNGSVVTLLVDPGQPVAKGDALLVMEAMKMEHAIRAPAAGRVTEFFFGPGELVDGGVQLLAFEVQAD